MSVHAATGCVCVCVCVCVCEHMIVCLCVNSHNCFFLTAVPDGVFMFHKLSGSHSHLFVQDLNCMCVQILHDFFLCYFHQVLH